MKNSVLLILAALISSTSYAGIIDASNYQLTELSGNFSYGRTDWNGLNEFGTLNNLTELGSVESLLSDGYTALSNGNAGERNGIYSGFPSAGFHSIEFSLNDDYLLNTFSFLSSRSYSSLTQVALEYALDGGAWQSAINTTSGALGITNGSALNYDLDFGGVMADEFRLTLNGGNQISFHEITIDGDRAVASVPAPGSLLLLGLGLAGLGFYRRKKTA